MIKVKIISFTLITFLFTILLVQPIFASSVLLNEFLAHPSTGNKEWVEFYNPDNTDLSSYWLDDDTDFNSDSGSSAKKSLATLNKDNPTYPYLEFSSFLNNSGDHVVLFSNEGNIIDQYQYTSDPGTDQSIGRSPDGGAWIALASTSKGVSNGDFSPTPTPTLSPSPSQTPTPTPSPSPTPRRTSNPTNVATPTPKSSPSSLPSPQSSVSGNYQNIPKNPSKQIVYKVASVAAATTSTPSASKEVEVKESKQFSPVKIIGILFILAGFALLGYIFLKSGIKSKTDGNLPN